MGTLPNITQTELAMVAAAVLLLFVVPAVLSWGDERRRRRAALAAESLRVALPVESSAPAPETPSLQVSSPVTPPPVDATAAPEGVSAVPVAIESSSAVGAPAPTEFVAPTAIVPPSPPELQPLSGAPRHRFRLDDLHQAQLPDWPPAAIRNDPERSRLRQEAERGAELYQTRLRATLIASPYPARSHCLGTADADAAELRLSFLLFPVLWPVSQNQAVAQAVFRIDRITGEIRGWVDALRPQELSEENRREIGEAGGKV